MNFAKTLKKLMKDTNTTQMRLAQAIGFSQRAVSKWVNGQSEPTEGAIVACAKYFGVSADEMLGFTEYEPKKADGSKKEGAARDEKLANLIAVYDSLSDYDKARLAAYADYINTEKY